VKRIATIDPNIAVRAARGEGTAADAVTRTDPAADAQEAVKAASDALKAAEGDLRASQKEEE